MLAQQRQAHILAGLDREGSVRVSDLVRELGVSDMTIRRDLDVLSRAGMLTKVHGGAVRADQQDSSSDEPGFSAKSTRRLGQKQAIGARAAELVEPGSAIAISAGTTTHTMARFLVGVPGLTVVTNSVPVADLFYGASAPDTSVVLTGGLRTPSDALVGPVAVSTLRVLHVDTVFLGIHGMDARAGFSTPNMMEAETDRALISCGRRLVVVADSSKWGVTGLSSVADLEEAHVLITDTGLPGDAQVTLGDRVGRLMLVDPGGP